MRNVDALIALIKDEFRSYDSASMIDENSMYRDIVLALRSFGNDSCDLQEAIIEIKGGKGKTPSNFFSLKSAFVCHREEDKRKIEVEYHDRIQYSVYVEDTQISHGWNECSMCCKGQSICEKHQKTFYIQPHQSGHFRYHSPCPMVLGKRMKKSLCDRDCYNKNVYESPYEINIFNDNIDVNFNEGTIYMMYQGLPTDEDGNIEIPDTPNGSLEVYLEYHLKSLLCERLMLLSDNTRNLSILYPIYSQKRMIAKKNASNELKSMRLNPKRLINRISYLNRKDTLKYENPHR